MIRLLSKTIGPLALAAALWLGFAAPMPAAAQTQPAHLDISVRGEAHATPDMATVSVGVVSEAVAADAAMAAQRERMNAVLAAVSTAGVAQRDIQTSGLSLSPRYAQPTADGAPRITGYQAANQVSVVVRDIERAGEILDLLVGAGANQIDGVMFGVQDPTVLKDQARRDAVAQLATRKAFYEKEAGLKLGRVLAMTESDGGGPIMMAQQARFEMSATPVAPGELTVTVDLSATYEIAE